MSKYYYNFDSSNKQTMTDRQLKLQALQSKMQKLGYNRVSEKSEIDFVREAITTEHKASKAGVLKLAWYFVKKKGLSLSEGMKKAWSMVKTRITDILQSLSVSRIGWTKFS